MSTDLENLNQPPFPPLQWDDCEWIGSVTLGRTPDVGLNVQIDDPDESRNPTDSQRAAFSLLVEDWEKLFPKVLDALLPHYRQIRPKYLDFLGEDVDESMPNVVIAKELEPLIDIRQVYVHQSSQNGVAYVGLLFGSTWDTEHGLGVIVHRDRVVKIGGADLSFSWSPPVS